MDQILMGLMTIVVAVIGCLGYFHLSNMLLDKVLFPAKGPNAGKNINRANMIRPWLFIFPTFFVLVLYLAYPVIETLRMSVVDRTNDNAFVGLDNYRFMFGEPKFWEAMKNNLTWLIVVPAASTALGLLAAQLTDRISWGNIAKSLIFMPMAISFVGASVIFKLIYDTRPIDQNQIGILNSVWLQFDGGLFSLIFLKILPSLFMLTLAGTIGFVSWKWLAALRESRFRSSTWQVMARVLGAAIGIWIFLKVVVTIVGIWTTRLPYGEPQTWLTIPGWNNFFLMAVLIWIQTGFAMVILSAALRGIPEETIEAAIIDGANPFEVFFMIKAPQIMPTILVVWTTITLLVLKVFDIVYAMTNGQWGTQVLANYMYDKLFSANDWGVGSAAAIVIMVLVSPILVWNVYQTRKEMK